MLDRVQWIAGGRRLPLADSPGASAGETDLLLRDGLVKILEDEHGTTVRWGMFSPNWSSLYFVAEWLLSARGPFHLQYYSAGWFNERHEGCWAAADRVRHLIQKSDVQLVQSVYIATVPKTHRDVPSLLRRAINESRADEDCSVDCTYDVPSRRFRVARIGPQSTIAKLWGVSPGCYPCRIGHAYDQAVSQVYSQVMRAGEPHYDHVYAAMVSTRGDVVWVPYQRVVVPIESGTGRLAVRIVTEVSRVEISPL
jgi:hypothetical protein